MKGLGGAFTTGICEVCRDKGTYRLTICYPMVQSGHGGAGEGEKRLRGHFITVP